jgi:hypothetical protein
MSYKFQFASDVKRDGMGVELLDDQYDVVAEVFRYERGGAVLFTAFRQNIPIGQITELLELARVEFEKVH